MRLTPVWVYSWAALQQKINAAEDGAVITLTNDLTVADGDTVLEIPYGKTITIDMAGRTLDRGLADVGYYGNNGQVIDVTGSNLTLKNGTITGGNGSTGGGIIVNYGSLIMENVTVMNNKAMRENWGQKQKDRPLNISLRCSGQQRSS